MLICTLCLIFTGALTLLWLVPEGPVREWLATRMKANSAITLTLIMLGVWAYRLRDRAGDDRARTRWQQAGLAIHFLAVLIPALTLAEYAFDWHLGIDQLWATDVISDENRLFPGRMAPNAALCFLLLAFEALASRGLGRAHRLTAMALGVSALIALLALMGYAYGAENLYSIGRYIRISPYTASVVTLLCAGRALDSRGAFRSALSSQHSGTRMALRFLPALLLPIVAGWIEIVGRRNEWWGREDGAALLVSFVVCVFFLFILQSALSQNAADEEKEKSAGALRTLNVLGAKLSAEHDQQRLAQMVTDTATTLTRAQFGAFFYNVANEKGGSYMLYTISGVPIEAFSKFPMPRNTAVFAPTFSGEGVVRSGNIRKDPRYGKSAPYHGMPEGHLPVTSYLAVSVVSRSGQVLGGLFFGHSEKNIFTLADEEIVKSLAAQAAVALDNSQLYRDLSSAVKARDEFLSLASHELKTPLTSLSLQLQLAQKRLGELSGDHPAETRARMEKSLAVCREQARRINGLVDDLLDVSRIEAGRFAFRFDTTDLTEVVEEAATRLADLLKSARCELRLENMAPRPFPAVVDRFRIDQVLENLLSNAAKYGAGKPVTLSLREVDGEAEIAVRDEGIGIPKDKQALVFDRFERVGGNANVSGLGLGLFITRQIVDAHAGRIIVESEPGKGSAFIVHIPLERAATTGEAAG